MLPVTLNPWHLQLARLAGYSLLLLAAFDIVIAFFPPRFGDFAWEVQLVGNLVERIPVPLVGLVLVLCTEPERRIRLGLARASLFAGGLFVLLLCLGLSATSRLNTRSVQLKARSLANQEARLEQAEVDLQQAETVEALRRVWVVLDGNLPSQSDDPEELRRLLLTNLAGRRGQSRAQLVEQLNNRRLELLRDAFKWSLGALVGAAVFLAVGWMALLAIRHELREERKLAEALRETIVVETSAP